MSLNQTSKYEDNLDFAKSEADTFMRAHSTPEIEESIHYLGMALKLLKESINEKSKKR